MVVFSIITLGLVPLLAGSIRGSNSARADTIGKNAALKAMERVRGLPFYISYATNTQAVDVLDLYYPAFNGTLTGADGKRFYRTPCPAAGNRACPVDIPTGYTLTFEARFVDPVTTGVPANPGEVATGYVTVNPPTTYSRAAATTDVPPRQLLRMDVIAAWTVGGDQNTYRMTSLLSDRQFGGLKTKGTASVGYGVQINTSFDTRKAAAAGGGGAGVQSVLTAVAATADSEIEGRRLSTAREVASAGTIDLNREPTGAVLGSFDGASSPALVAPPSITPPNGDGTAGAGAVNHPDFASAPTAGLGATAVTNVRAEAAGSAQHAAGDVTFPTAAAGTEYLWAKDPQLVPADYNAFNLLSSSGSFMPSVAALVRANGLPAPILTTPATSGATVVGGTMARTQPTFVESQATTGFDRLLLLRSNFIPDPAPVLGGGTLSGAAGAIVVIDDFQAAVRCTSTDAGSGTAESSYRATLYYWQDVTNNNTRDGRYVPVTLSANQDSTGTDPLAALQALPLTQQPLVYDGGSAVNDIYLFGGQGKRFETGTGAGSAAYITEWSSVARTSARLDPRTDAAGQPVRASNASIDSAISITTGDFDTTKNVQSVVTVSVGSLTCLAEDLR